jgi:hypothetical protein
MQLDFMALPGGREQEREAREHEETHAMTEETGREMLEIAGKLFERMISQQQAKVLRLAREVIPHITPEELRNPHDFPQLKEHPTFEFEDGLLSGLISAQVAMNAEIKGRLLPPEPPRP